MIYIYTVLLLLVAKISFANNDANDTLATTYFNVFNMASIKTWLVVIWGGVFILKIITVAGVKVAHLIANRLSFEYSNWSNARSKRNYPD